MKFSISLVCLALLSTSPLCWAYSNADLEADKLRVGELIRTSQNEDAKISNTQELLDIYGRASSRFRPEDREGVDRLIREHNHEILVDGVPIQGGRRKGNIAKEIGKEILGTAAKEVATGFFNELGASIWSLFTGKPKTQA